MNSSEVKTISNESQTDSENAIRYISFQVATESYALEVEYVKEILGIQTFTPVPQVPDYIVGVMNLRGKIVPVMDIRLRFSMEKINWDRNTSIIVVHYEETDLGLVVDKMNEVMDLFVDDIKYSKPNNSEAHEFIKGMAEYNSKIQMLVDLSQLLDKSKLV